MAVEEERPGTVDDDPAAGALDDIAATAEGVADEQGRLATEARALASRRRDGATWTQLVDGGGTATVVRTLRHSAALLTAAARGLQAALARVLTREGLTTRQIGRRFGVSHQRISSLMSRRDD